MDSLVAPIVDPARQMRHEEWHCLAGLTDEEYFWEPVPGTWTVCRRELASVAEIAGSGAWVLEFPSQAPMPWYEKATIRAWTEWFTLHNTHHCAEVGCMRDLLRQLGDARPTATRTRHG